MTNKFTKRLEIMSSDADYASLLSYPDIFAQFMDIATEHSKLLNYDQSVLTPRGLFWVIAKSKVRIYDRPALGEVIDLSTWPEKPDRIRGRRNYTIDRNGERLIEGTTEWVIIDRNTGRLYMLNNLYDPDFEFNSEIIIPEPFHRFSSSFDGEPFAEYTVRSIDIDFEGHMNNVAYVRALVGLFSREELEQMKPREIDFQYKVSCYEGDRLFWYKTQTDDGLELCARLADKTDIFYARIR